MESQAEIQVYLKKRVNNIFWDWFGHKNIGNRTMLKRYLIAISLFIFVLNVFATDVGGYVSTNTTWTCANSPYHVTSDIIVGNKSSVTLTIKPGVTVIFDPGTGIKIGWASVSWGKPGALHAVGKEDSLITFTSASGLINDWDVVVTNPGQQSLILAEDIRIGEGYVDLWVDIVGRNQLRLGREQSYPIIFGNSGNIAAYDAMLIRIPKDVDHYVDFPLTELDGIDWNTVPYTFGA